MNKKILFTLLISTLTLAGCAQKNEDTTNNPSSPTITEDAEQGTTSMKGVIEEVNDEWNQYTNSELGFSIEYPKVNFVNDQERNVEIIEDGKVVYISDGQNQEEIDQKKGLSDFEKASGIPFAILIQDASSDEELENFIKQRYGEGCKLGQKQETNKEGIFSVNIEGLTEMGSADNTEGCFVNYAGYIRYSPEKGKVASWDLGQDINFYKKDNTPLDGQISDSFEFL